MSDKPKHTPGPWGVDVQENVDLLVGQQADSYFVKTPTDEGAEYVAEVMGPANARLIASAPDLLAACKLAAERVANGGVIAEVAAAAIAKAEGTE